jgi:hypothetical protein
MMMTTEGNGKNRKKRVVKAVAPTDALLSSLSSLCEKEFS